jgi:glucose-1-phosphate adenylyltransferase
VHEGARVADSLVSPGVHVFGSVTNCVLAPGVVVEEGAEVRDCVVLHDTTIERGATVERAVLDAEVRIGAGARIGGPRGTGEEDEGITLVGLGETVPAGTRLAPGSRFPAEDERQ